MHEGFYRQDGQMLPFSNAGIPVFEIKRIAWALHQTGRYKTGFYKHIEVQYNNTWAADLVELLPQGHTQS